jgi:hypothetical protein
MDERPHHTLVLDLTTVLRELSERQRDLLAVIRHVRLARTAGTTAPRPTVVPAPAIEGRRTPVLASAPPALASGPRVPAPPAPAPPGAPHARRPRREYDYFDELDDRLARLAPKQEEDPL